jgi:hypothetical protein
VTKGERWVFDATQPARLQLFAHRSAAVLALIANVYAAVWFDNASALSGRLRNPDERAHLDQPRSAASLGC